jgi:hypothetical protein
MRRSSANSRCTLLMKILYRIFIALCLIDLLSGCRLYQQLHVGYLFAVADFSCSYSERGMVTISSTGQKYMKNSGFPSACNEKSFFSAEKYVFILIFLRFRPFLSYPNSKEKFSTCKMLRNSPPPPQKKLPPTLHAEC